MTAQLVMFGKRKKGRKTSKKGKGEPEAQKGMPHRKRAEHVGKYPAHVTWKVIEGLPSLRRFDLARVIGETMRGNSRWQEGKNTSFGVVHFSIQSNHLHLIVEAVNKKALTAGLRGLAIWMARRINKVLGRTGRIMADRYHTKMLTSAKQVRNTLVYVLQNHRHHSDTHYEIDPLSSARWFTGWDVEWVPPPNPPVRAARTGLMKGGWLNGGGPIGFHEQPKH